MDMRYPNYQTDSFKDGFKPMIHHLFWGNERSFANYFDFHPFNGVEWFCMVLSGFEGNKPPTTSIYQNLVKTQGTRLLIAIWGFP